MGDRLHQKLTQKAAELGGKSDLPTIEWAKKYCPEHTRRSMCDLHIELASTADELRYTRGQNRCIIAPRGNAKSTWMSLINPLRAICEKTERYILIIADTADQAAKHLAAIKDELLYNEELIAEYPLACQEGDVWNADRIETKNGVCVEAIGKGAKARGRRYKRYRPTLVIVDDPQGDEDVESPDTRTKDMAWFDKALMYVGDTDTNFFIVGTMLHRECIVAQLEKRPNFITIKLASIREWPTNMDLWNDWENLYTSFVPGAAAIADKFYIEHKSDMDAGAVVLWPEKEDLYELMKIRAIGHSAFNSEKQNDPRDPSKCEFDEAWVSPDRKDVWYHSRPASAKCICVMYCDPAKGGETKKHDDGAIISLFYDIDKRRAYVEVQLKKQPVNMMLADLIKLRKINQPEYVGFEINGFQELAASQLEVEDPFCPIFPIENRVNKQTRISRLGIWLQRGFFLFKIGCRDTQKLISQLIDHPHAAHDDGSDGLEGCLRVLSNVVDMSEIEVGAEVEVTAQMDDGLGDNIFQIGD
jgi:phage terminase large subunit-like protein